MSEFQRKIIIKSEYGEQEFPYDRPILHYVNMYNRKLTIAGLDPIPFPPTSYLEIKIIEKENVAKIPKKKKKKQYVYNKVGPNPFKEPIRNQIPDQENEITSTNDEPPAKKPRTAEHTISVQDHANKLYDNIKNYLHEKYKQVVDLPYTPYNATVIKQYLQDNIAKSFPTTAQGVKDAHTAYKLALSELRQAVVRNI